MKNKTYTTASAAYKAAQEAKAQPIGLPFYADGDKVVALIDKMYRNASNRVFAQWNVCKCDNKLFVLHNGGTDGYAWKELCALDKKGAVVEPKTEKSKSEKRTPKTPKAEKPKTEKRKADKRTPEKPKTDKKRTPKNGKGSGKHTPKNPKDALKADLDKLAGTGDNSAAHKVMVKHGLKDSRSDEYQDMWKGYWWTIR